MSPRHKGLDRRQFFKTAGAAGLGAALAGGGAKAAAAETMPLRTFGRSGIKVPMLSLGTMWDTVNNQIVLRRAFSLGVTYWDTAASYHGGHSETGVGKYFARFPQHREKIFLVTKASRAHSLDDMTALLDRSLKKLQTSHVDLYFVHSIGGVDDLFPGLEKWAAQQKAAGKIKLFGFSTHRNMAECLMGGSKLGYIDGIMFTYNHRIMHTSEMNEAVQACADAGIGLTAMKTQGGGPVKSGGAAEVALAERFLAKGYTPEQVKLKAVWTDPRIASLCSQMPDLTILNANAAAALDRTKLTAGDMRSLDAYARSTAGCYCAGCAGLCEGAMQGAAPVQRVMRSLMYREHHREPEWTREILAGLDEGQRRALAEADFTPAERACPQGLEVGRLMRRAARLMA